MLTSATPATLGLSALRLDRIGGEIARRVDEGRMPGAVALVARRGRVGWFRAFGFRDRDAGAAMERDAVFRIASMTKPVTSLAALILVERGALNLGAPLAEYLPVFSDPMVAVCSSGGIQGTEPARRAPTILDLLRHTAGFAYGWYGVSPVKAAYRAAQLDAIEGPAEWCAALASLPLEFHPGTAWAYSEATAVLSHVIEAVAGQRLDDFIAREITGPLGMVDSGFRLDGPGLARLAEAQADPVTGARPTRPPVNAPPIRCRGGGGMVATAMDYARFCQLFLNRGRLGPERLVSRKTVEVMMADHLPPGIAGEPDAAAQFGPRLPLPSCGMGFGLGFAVRTAKGRAPWQDSPGTCYWAGATGCAFLIDPVEDLQAILMTHAPDQLVANMALLRTLAYGALDD
jgi:CubicO group peptidase (beta-lactamase class C family)